MRGDFIDVRVVVSVADHLVSFLYSSQLRNRVDIRRGTLTFCTHSDFKGMVWIALRIIRVRYPILAECDHLA